MLDNTNKELKNILPNHAPPPSIWDKIEEDLDFFDKNEPVLQTSVKNLPSYAPPPSIWDKIEEDLNIFDKLKELPVYTPPKSLWNGITQTLDTAPQAKVFSLRTWHKYAIAASVIATIFTFSLIFYQNATNVGNEKITVAYSEEKFDPTPIKEDWDEDESAFAKVEEICQQQAFICEQPEIKTLKSELDELNEAKQSIKNALGAYGTDETMVAELVAVEKERSEVLKKIMAKI